MKKNSRRKVLVLGAGIIGLASAYHLVNDGNAVAVLDAAPDGDKASVGNAGGIAVTEVVPASVPGLARRVPGWLFDPLGPLSIRARHAPKLAPWLLRFLRAGSPTSVAAIARALAALNARAHDDWQHLLTELDLEAELHRAGALAVYETDTGFERDAKEWDLRRSFGIICEPISGSEARNIEPALGAIVKRAVWTPQWSHVSDPKRILDQLLLRLRNQSAQIETGVAAELRPANDKPGTVRTADGRIFTFDAAVVAAGAWSAQIASQVGDRAFLESERGYNTTLAHPGLSLGREIIFAERKFVAVPLAPGLRIGGAAEFAGLNAPPNYLRSKALLASAKRYLPELNVDRGVEWMGHRPATPDSLPVIGRSPKHSSIFYAFGHGHLGLTQAATTGRMISDLVAGRAPILDLSPYQIERFA